MEAVLTGDDGLRVRVEHGSTKDRGTVEIHVPETGIDECWNDDHIWVRITWDSSTCVVKSSLQNRPMDRGGTAPLVFSRKVNMDAGE